MHKWIAILGALALAGCGSRYQAPIGQAGDPLFLNSGRQHLVNDGETLYAIAWMYDLDPNLLARANHLDASATVTPGQKLLVDLRGFSSNSVVATPAAAVAVATPVENGAVATARPATGLGGLQRAPLPSGDSGGRPTRTALPSANDAGTAATPAPATPPASTTAATPAGGKLSEGAKATTGSARAATSTATTVATTATATTATTGAAAVTATAGAATTGAAAASKPASPFSGTADVNWAWPYRGNIVGRFSDSGSDSKGIDIAGKEGDAVLAAADGEVVYAGNGLLRYGNLLIIKHNDKYLSAYAHNKALLVGEKTKVTKGQKIAELGSSGIDKNQLHFEIRVDGKPADPLTFLPAAN